MMDWPGTISAPANSPYWPRGPSCELDFGGLGGWPYLMYVSFVQLINPTTRVSIYISALKIFVFLGRRNFPSLHWLFILKDIIVVIGVDPFYWNTGWTHCTEYILGTTIIAIIDMHSTVLKSSRVARWLELDSTCWKGSSELGQATSYQHESNFAGNASTDIWKGPYGPFRLI